MFLREVVSKKGFQGLSRGLKGFQWFSRGLLRFSEVFQAFSRCLL